MNRAMSQGQAMRSMTGRSRVTHFMSVSFDDNPPTARYAPLIFDTTVAITIVSDTMLS
jgi:hypothetical protein